MITTMSFSYPISSDIITLVVDLSLFKTNWRPLKGQICTGVIAFYLYKTWPVLVGPAAGQDVVKNSSIRTGHPHMKPLGAGGGCKEETTISHPLFSTWFPSQSLGEVARSADTTRLPRGEGRAMARLYTSH